MRPATKMATTNPTDGEEVHIRCSKRNPKPSEVEAGQAATDEDVDEEGWDGLFLEEDDDDLESNADMDDF